MLFLESRVYWNHLSTFQGRGKVSVQPILPRHHLWITLCMLLLIDYNKEIQTLHRCIIYFMLSNVSLK